MSKIVPNDRIEKLMNKILSIPGNKIITLSTDQEQFTIDISKDNKIGYDPAHKLLFMAKLVNAMHYGGGLIIRQFLPMRIKRKSPDGKERWLPEKCLYGIILINNNWSGISAKELQIACETDSSTSKQLPHEAGVHYKNLDI